MKINTTFTIGVFLVFAGMLHASNITKSSPGIGLQTSEEIQNWKQNAVKMILTHSTKESFYTGKPYDRDKNGYTFMYRDFNPELGRWTTIDPSGFPDGANNQAYIPIPTTQFDYEGLAAVPFTNTASFSHSIFTTGMAAESYSLNQTVKVDYFTGASLVAGPIFGGNPSGSITVGAGPGTITESWSVTKESVTIISSTLAADNTTDTPPDRTYDVLIHSQAQFNVTFTGNAGVTFTYKGVTYTLGVNGTSTFNEFDHDDRPAVQNVVE